MATLLLEELQMEQKAKEFGVNKFERVWLPGDEMSLVSMSDIAVEKGKLVQKLPVWVNSYRVSEITSRLIEDLRPVERPGVNVEGEQLERVGRFMTEARLPGLVATYLGMNTQERVEDFVPVEGSEPRLMFGISGPPGAMKSTMVAELARRTGYPIAVVEPKYQNWNAARYLEVIEKSGGSDFSGARRVIGEYIGKEGRERKEGIQLQAPGDTRSMRDVLKEVAEMFKGGGSKTKWVLADLGGLPRVKSLGFVGARERNRGLNIFDLVGQESLELVKNIDEGVSDEEAERKIKEWMRELEDEAESRGKWERFAGAVKKSGW